MCIRDRPNTDPIIDNVSIVDFLKRRGRDKSKINIFPCASLTKNIEGTNMTEFGLLAKKGIIAFTDGIKTVQNTSLMSRIMNSAKDLDCLIMQHAEDYHLCLLYTSPSPRDGLLSRMPSSA